MSTKAKITLGLPDHPRCQAIIDGRVGIEGYELHVDPNFTSSGADEQALRLAEQYFWWNESQPPVRVRP